MKEQVDTLKAVQITPFGPKGPQYRCSDKFEFIAPANTFRGRMVVRELRFKCTSPALVILYAAPSPQENRSPLGVGGLAISVIKICAGSLLTPKKYVPFFLWFGPVPAKYGRRPCLPPAPGSGNICLHHETGCALVLCHFNKP